MLGDLLVEGQNDTRAFIPSVVERVPWKREIPAHGTDLNDRSSQSFRVNLAEDSQHFPSHIHGAPKVHLHFMACVRIRDGLEVGQQAIAGVVDQDIDAPKSLNGGGNH